MSKIYEYAKIVNRRADKNTRLYWKPYEDFADGLVWEWENKTQFNMKRNIWHTLKCVQNYKDHMMDFLISKNITKLGCIEIIRNRAICKT